MFISDQYRFKKEHFLTDEVQVYTVTTDKGCKNKFKMFYAHVQRTDGQRKLQSDKCQKRSGKKRRVRTKNRSLQDG